MWARSRPFAVSVYMRTFELTPLKDVREALCRFTELQLSGGCRVWKLKWITKSVLPQVGTHKTNLPAEHIPFPVERFSLFTHRTAMIHIFAQGDVALNDNKRKTEAVYFDNDRTQHHHHGEPFFSTFSCTVVLTAAVCVHTSLKNASDTTSATSWPASCVIGSNVAGVPSKPSGRRPRCSQKQRRRKLAANRPTSKGL